MKSKKFHKKLSLNKKTVSHLNNAEMKGARGGHQSGLTCHTCSIIVCILTENYTCTCPTTL